MLIALQQRYATDRPSGAILTDGSGKTTFLIYHTRPRPAAADGQSVRPQSCVVFVHVVTFSVVSGSSYRGLIFEPL
jgi:hypothetical protein